MNAWSESESGLRLSVCSTGVGVVGFGLVAWLVLLLLWFVLPTAYRL